MEIIRNHGEDCYQALQSLLQGEGPAFNILLLIAEGHLIRFNLFAADIDLFGVGKNSIDHRFRENARVHAMVSQLLEALLATSQRCFELSESIEIEELSVLEGMSTNFEPGAIAMSSNAQGKRQFEQFSAEDDDGDGEMRSMAGNSERPKDLISTHKRIDDHLGRLIRLSQSLKQHQRAKTEVIADRFMPKDSDGEAEVHSFKGYIDFCLRDFEQSYIRDRLERTLLRRWRRLSYYVSIHVPTDAASELPISPPKVVQPSVRDLPNRQSKAVSTSARGAKPRTVTFSLNQSTGSPSVAAQSVGRTVSTGFDPERSLSRNPAISNSKSLIGTVKSDFPRPPNVPRQAHEFQCPLCATVQPASMLEKQAWECHVMHDIAPYICLYSDCPNPETLYHASDTWLEHMENEHQQKTWLCKECGRQFATEPEYADHLLPEHGLQATPSELARLSKMNESRNAAAALQSCLFCNDSSENVPDVTLHIAEHLRQLAFLSLPWGLLSTGESDTKNNSDADNESRARMKEFIRSFDQPWMMRSDPLDDVEPVSLSTLKAAVGTLNYSADIDAIRTWSEAVTAIDNDVEASSPESEAEDDLPLKREPLWRPFKPAYVHHPLADPSGETRLLILRPGQAGDPVFCHLQAVSTSDLEQRRYKALSYVWGPPEPLEAINIHGAEFSIRSNLFSALEHLRSRFEEVVIWVDALCISVQDLHEKSNQIQLMPQIFGSAECVIAWMGECNDGEDRALDLLERVDIDNVDVMAAEKTLSTSWASLARFTDNPIFSRRWLVQEFALARAITLVCGPHFLTWTEFASKMTVIRISGRPNINTNVYTLIELIGSEFREDPKGSNREYLLGLETLVPKCAGFDVIDPRDAIYALVSLAKPTSIPPPAPDYCKSVVEVYTEFVDWAIQTSGSLDIICRPWAIESDHRLPSWIQYRLPKAKHIRSDTFVGLPGQRIYNTWRNMSVWIGDNSLKRGITERGAAYKRQVRISNKRFKAKTGKLALPTSAATNEHATSSGVELPSASDEIGEPDLDVNQESMLRKFQHSWEEQQFLPQGKQYKALAVLCDAPLETVAAWFDRNRILRSRFMPSREDMFIAQRGFGGLSLCTHGFVLDTVGWTSDGVDTNAMLVEASRFDQGDKTAWRVLVADRDGRREPAPLYFSKAYDECLKQVTSNRSLNIEHVKEENGSVVRDFISRVQTVTEGRKLVLGERFRGVAPGGTRPGDLICTLFGCSVPCVLRSNAMFYALIGAAYVDGIMDGEWLREHTKDEKARAQFVEDVQEFVLM